MTGAGPHVDSEARIDALVEFEERWGEASDAVVLAEWETILADFATLSPLGVSDDWLRAVDDGSKLIAVSETCEEFRHAITVSCILCAYVAHKG